MYEPAIFTRKKSHVTITWLIHKRFMVKSPSEINAGILVLLLNDFFPSIRFISSGKPGENLSITNYISEKNGKWILDIAAMSRSKEKGFACLFPDSISSWDEAKARNKYGCADVIRFFVDTENDKFLKELNKLKKAGLVHISGESVPGDFFVKLNYNGKPVWEEWNFSKIVLHKMRHSPPNIYEAFGYFGHKYYTLFGFALDSVSNSAKADTEAFLLKSGTGVMNNAVQSNFPGVEDFNINLQTALFEITQETLESVPLGKSMYAPTELDVFIKQLKGRMPDIYKKSADSGQDNADTFTPSDRKTINNHLEKMTGYIADPESALELQRVRLSGTYREKINLLHRLLSKPVVRKQYDPREVSVIHGLFLKQYKPVSLDKPLVDSEDDGAFTGHDLIGDEQFLKPDEYLVWTSFFKDEFKNEFEEARLEKFLECLPGHFAQFPFDVNSAGNLTISKYSKKILFTTFCSVAGIAPDNELWKPFLVLIQRAIDTINEGETLRR